MKMGINFIFEFHVLLFLPPFVSKLVSLGSIQKKDKRARTPPPHHQEIEFSNFTYLDTKASTSHSSLIVKLI